MNATMRRAPDEEGTIMNAKTRRGPNEDSTAMKTR